MVKDSGAILASPPRCGVLVSNGTTSITTGDSHDIVQAWANCVPNAVLGADGDCHPVYTVQQVDELLAARDHQMHVFLGIELGVILALVGLTLLMRHMWERM